MRHVALGREEIVQHTCGWFGSTSSCVRYQMDGKLRPRIHSGLCDRGPGVLCNRLRVFLICLTLHPRHPPSGFRYILIPNHYYT